MTNEYKIREICGDWGLDIPRPDLTGVLIFNSRSNAELVKAILEWEDAHPNKAVPFQSTHIGEPLTLEQLRDMDGKPVWCEWLLPEDKAVESGKWFIVVIGDLTGLKILRPLEFGNCFCKEEEYGETWLAYAYPPAHIDREAWDECEYCDDCASCRNASLPEWDHICSACVVGVQDSYEPMNFCPECGRPLTEEGWAMLEKRLRV